MKRHLYASMALVPMALASAHVSWAQGNTTSAMSGIVTDKTGEGLPGATVIAVHTPTNTQYVAPTNSEGRFNIQGMRVGGPYTVRITFVGYKEAVRENIFLTLGQNQRLDINLSETGQTLSEVVVTGRQDPIINSGRTGAATTVQREQIERLPTLSRSFGDFTRLTPQANGQNFAGRSGGFNNITIDGALFNNSFGLSSTVGGQTNAQPISIDAIEQIQVSIAPYDVRQGSFTGAGINAVTRSGSNKFSGSAYYFLRNEDFIGRKAGDLDQKFPPFNLDNYGFRLGGPVIKDKLFFFVNAEREKRSDPGTTFIANRDGTPAPGGNSNTSQASADELSVLRNFLQTQYGYNPGVFEGYNLRQESQKATAKIDWNIAQGHRFSVKYNYLRSLRDVNPSNSGSINGRSASRFGLPFFSSFYTINNNLDSYIAELNSTFGSRFSNNLTAGYTAFRDFRESPGGGNFPLVDIGNGTGLSAPGSRINASNTLTSFGYEPFSANNILNTDVYQIGDNFTAYLGKHNVTVGTYNEFYKFQNGFAPNFFGAYQFNSLADFYSAARTTNDPSQPGYNGYTLVDGVPTPRPVDPNQPSTIGFPQRYQLQYSTQPDGSFPFAEIRSVQLGLYAQDEWTPFSNLKVTVGLRGDLPFVTSDLPQNEAVANLTFRDGVRINSGQVPKKTVLFSPRVGFNWDVLNDKTTQLRGGTGIFTGRVPFVWISNQASNNGVLFGSFDRNNSGPSSSTSGFPFSPDVNAYRPVNAAANTSYNLAVTAPDFKFPQVWRTNLAVDQALPGGIIASLEGLYTKDINATYHANVNLPQAQGNAAGADTRPIFYSLGAPDPTTGLVALRADNRIFTGQGGVSASNPVITDAIEMRNTRKGYSYAITGQLQKSFSNGLYASASYTYSDARSVNDGGSIAQSIWRDRQISGDPNENVLSYSNFLQQHRVLLSASYRREYINHLATAISFVYDASPAYRFSYVYSGDMNGDGQTSNDLMYIPRDQSEIVLNDIVLSSGQGGGRYTAAQQWADLDNFISQDKYLSARRGSYAERNGAVAPWFRQLDVKLLQDVFTNIGESKNTLQFSLDIFNVGNLLSKNWGTVRSTNRTNPLRFAGYDSQGRPAFTFPYQVNPSLNTTDNTVTPGQPLADTFFRNNGSLGSRWQMQVGLRYIFN
ncbi:TonB-dependent receptor [Hymenobacter sp. NST-14]|uniref:TonB-dependent receptor n=1 Tax=Hymenobacter piscis TaxID=2839984 RepID=UPI001C0181C7|nr:TonB-dependent receptor [Hymenobacter piscis]MBT9393973.1 TonB-dependent receptor [Hymenobacter piscis]